MKAVIYISIAMIIAGLIAGFIKINSMAMEKIDRLQMVCDSLQRERNELEIQNAFMFHKEVILQERLDSLIHGNTPQDSILTKLYDIRHGEL